VNTIRGHSVVENLPVGRPPAVEDCGTKEITQLIMLQDVLFPAPTRGIKCEYSIPPLQPPIITSCYYSQNEFVPTLDVQNSMLHQASVATDSKRWSQTHHWTTAFEVARRASIPNRTATGIGLYHSRLQLTRKVAPPSTEFYDMPSSFPPASIEMVAFFVDGICL
jgi:hypothetical protein